MTISNEFRKQAVRRHLGKREAAKPIPPPPQKINSADDCRVAPAPASAALLKILAESDYPSLSIEAVKRLGKGQ